MLRGLHEAAGGISRDQHHLLPHLFEYRDDGVLGRYHKRQKRRFAVIPCSGWKSSCIRCIKGCLSLSLVKHQHVPKRDRWESKAQFASDPSCYLESGSRSGSLVPFKRLPGRGSTLSGGRREARSNLFRTLSSTIDSFLSTGVNPSAQLHHISSQSSHPSCL